MTITPKLIVRFALVAEQPNSRDEERLSAVSSENSIAGIKRYTGFVRGRDLFGLFDHVSLEANPRAAKVGSVTTAILESLETTPELFPFKSKGILIGTSSYVALQRNRFELAFEDPASEGILDGGHNMLAIGLHMLSAVAEEKEIARINLWEDMKELWTDYRMDLEREKESFDFLVPVELLVPSDLEDVRAVQQFEMSVLDIALRATTTLSLRKKRNQINLASTRKSGTVLIPRSRLASSGKAMNGKAAKRAQLRFATCSLCHGYPLTKPMKPICYHSTLASPPKISIGTRVSVLSSLIS
jgi:hypothetical protein